MEDKAFRMTMLFDFYGDLLTDRQREFFDLYHNEDLSLAEIAENAGITRQGVRDVLVRAEATLNEFEEKTGLIQRFLKVRAGLRRIEADAEQIAAVEAARFLTPEEVTAFNKELDPDHYGFFLSDYRNPTEINWSEVLYNGAGISVQPGKKELDAYLEASGMDELYTEIMAKDEFEFDTGIDFSYAVKLYKAKK